MNHDVWLHLDLVARCLCSIGGAYLRAVWAVGHLISLLGGTAAFQERGIIPRSIAMIYQELNKQTDFEWSTRVSYLQIYNEKGPR